MAKKNTSNNKIILYTIIYAVLAVFVIVLVLPFLGGLLSSINPSNAIQMAQQKKMENEESKTKDEILDELETFVADLINRSNLEVKTGYSQYSFERDGANTDGNWALFTITSEVLKPDSSAHFAPWDSHYVVGKKVGEKQWVVALQGSEEYFKILKEMPESFLSTSAKEAFGHTE